MHAGQNLRRGGRELLDCQCRETSMGVVVQAAPHRLTGFEDVLGGEGLVLVPSQ